MLHTRAAGKTVARLFCGLTIGAALNLGISETRAETINGFDLSDTLVPRSEIAHGGPLRDGIPALTDPKFIPAGNATFLDGNDRILGVAHKGIAKAYPLSLLNWHEIVNDSYDGEPIVVVYCPLCFTGTAFKATLDGRRHHFGVSGLLYNSDVLLYDRQTESLWSQILFQAISGPLKKRRLQAVPVANTTWSDWRRKHPKTFVLSRETGHQRDYDRNPYAAYDQSLDVTFPIRFRSEGYHPKEYVLGVVIDGRARAYPFSELAKSKTPFEETISGQRVSIQYDDTALTASVLDKDGNVLPSMIGYWFAWYAFYPETEVYKAASRKDSKAGASSRR